MLIDRDEERRAVGGVLDGVRAGRGGVLLVTGAPGMGKTALLAQAEHEAAGLAVLRATGAEFEAGFTWAGLHQLLRPVIHQVDALPPEQAAALRGAFRLGPGRDDDPFVVYLATLTLLSQVAAGRGVVCLVDDVHWLDDQSADALRFLARRIDRDPIGLVLAARDGVPHRLVADPWPQLRLAPISRNGSLEVIARSAPVEVASAVAERLLEHAAGNPLALQELPAALAPDQLTGRAPLPRTLPLGPGLEAVFLQHVRRLAADAQQFLLVTVCAAGAPWSAVVAAAARLGLADHTLDLEDAELIRCAPDGVQLRHPLLGSALTAATSPARRRAVHAALADV
ncbi:MAG TPA: ATP-binding protein, partial [Kineosporiaceae bacterium]